MSDCVGAAWHNGNMRQIISEWTSKLPTVVFHVFPERLWARTAVARSVVVNFRCKATELANRNLLPVARSIWDQERLVRSLDSANVRLPILSLEKDSVSGWAKMVAGDRRSRCLGIVWDALPVTPPANKQSVDLKDRIDYFVLSTSPVSRQLAALLCSAPVITLPIARLIKQSILSHASSVHLAEVFMSGLLRVSGEDVPTFENAERLAYELVDEEVRDRLRAGTRVLDALDVFTAVSNYVARGLGRSIDEFWAILRTPGQGSSSEETSFLNAFASVSVDILRGLGSEFEAIANTLAPSDLLYSGDETSDFPPLEPFEFLYAQLIDETDDRLWPPPLETETYTIITLEVEALKTFNIKVPTLVNQKRWLRSDQWQIQTQLKTVQGYTETLPNEVSLEMIAIPGGTFLMGSPENEEGRTDDESPQHQVSIASFFMGRYPITQAQWRSVANLPQVQRALETAPSHFKGDNRPVERVSWDEVVEFCARLSASTGREYRLPTEAEWEYACRAGTTTPFHFGEMITIEVANYNGNSYAGGPTGKSKKETTPVDYFGYANAFGLSDMHGNVFEWCQDHWHDNYEGAPADGSAWLTVHENARRILRGGSWDLNPRICRSAYRLNFDPDFRNSSIGFRVSCASPRALS